MQLKTKQPNETLDFDVDCRKRMDNDDAIVSVTATITGPDAVLVNERVSFYDETIAKIYVSGGTNDVTYKVTLLITTMNGRVIEHEFLIHVKDL